MEMTVEARLTQLEARVAALEGHTNTPRTPETSKAESTYWLVEALEPNRELPDGSVIFGGNITLGRRAYAYQWQRPTTFVTDESWSENLERLSALAHPVRGEILRRLLAAPATAAELVEEGIVTSTGTAYHHLSALTNAGWTTKTSGEYSIRSARVIPLLTIITASEAH
ncbi:winged helix-turn-helix domain-containing protein [Corynebacterium sp. MSK218]|uniref:ArsR/SmtB family transcription factor n=1 Tax=Corynebacterium sp. MSK218 TaxID=3050218 RepID=UPI00254BED39|nr:winged helix-turn-helix domain-containing protein [Corynebacterium sp. MSK218]MDK8764489.1 winged helix-turn-helix domain-containing protein [Corynebacterium sp. MSK218]